MRQGIGGLPGGAGLPSQGARSRPLIQAAINGVRKRTEHPGLPHSPSELAAAASASVAAGAGAIHLHVRDGQGRESLKSYDVAAALNAVRAACPGVPIGVCTGAWIEPDPRHRHHLIERWQVLPDFASVNFDEPGAAAVAALLSGRNVAVEAGLANDAAASALQASGLARFCLRVLLEPQEQDLAAARKNVAEMEEILERAGIELPRLLHGVDATAWPMIEHARERGYDTRVGFEDVLLLPDGSVAPSNAALVQAATAILSPR